MKIASIIVTYDDGSTDTLVRQGVQHPAQAPAPAPAPAPTPAPAPAPAPVVPKTRLEGHKANVEKYFGEGERGQVLALYYLDYIGGYKSQMQDWLAFDLCPRYGLRYAIWTDPKSFAKPENQDSVRVPVEWSIMYQRIQTANALPA